MLRGSPGQSPAMHPGVAQAIPSIAFIAQVYGGARRVPSSKTSEVKLTDQQRPAQAPDHETPPTGRRSLGFKPEPRR